MAKQPNHSQIYDIKTTLGSTTGFNGTMRFSSSLQINGRFEGRIESPGFLYIHEGAEVIADIKVGSILIGGLVRGNVEASQELEIVETGQVYGNLKANVLKIADGVIFEGKVEMIGDPQGLDIFSASANQLKQSLQGE
ncbi:bactofilin family protein [Spirochaeta cellobiosiphila]|uniref:bactofilin family protein n=1 Tax=Spirochaeta cellobiosiphila TaxID=504483 RepID=UPI0003FD948F|nr:polymer-forming cytoskeletal protein [Spirochaeta cellobiosiphila]